MRNLLLISLLLIFSCKDAVKQNLNSEDVLRKEVITQNKGAEEAKKWLEKSIVEYFKADISEHDKMMRDMTTKKYYEFKKDATNVDLNVDGSLTLKQFQEKWEKDYDINFAGINTGFLISGQDWINVEVRKCEAETALLNVYTFNVILADDGFKTQYRRNIKVIKEDDRFQIDGIIELN
jgi:hypothetical protein